jgi:hypothetical protein
VVKSVESIKQWDLPIKETAKHIKEYCGIADCYGIESFAEYPIKNAAVLEIRATSNRQRHAVVYVVRLNDVDAEYVRGYIADEKYARALDKLKNCAINGQVLLSGGGNTKTSWDLIPNPKLDPWGK